MSENLLNLIRKLKELADRGEGGEKENAGNKLQQLLDKHGISLEDINEDVLKDREFTLKPHQLKFFIQVVCSCFGRECTIYKYQKDRKRNELVRILKLTDAQFLELSAKFDFFWDKYEKDLDIFYSAFIQKNDLYVKGSSLKDDLTQEQLDEINKVREMMYGLKKHSFHKQLNN
jgi:hypothetical protein